MKRYISLLILLSSIITALGVPARKGLHTYIQPDGTEVKVTLNGDERHHYYLSEDGYLVSNHKGFFYYADADKQGNILRSDFRLPSSADDRKPLSENLQQYLSSIDRNTLPERMATAYKKAQATRSKAEMPGGPGLYPSASYPTKGEQRSLVILVEFSDKPMTLDDPYDYFNRMLNENGFSDYTGTGSARDYFIENSDGQFIPHFDLYGPVTLPNSMAYYGSNDAMDNDRRPAQMIADACKLLDEEVDFSQYDLDNDGFIDNVFVFYAGEGEAAGGEPDTIWPHSWYVTAGIAKKQIFDGVTLDRYACSCEWVMTNRRGRPDGVGTFIHEFSHVLGLPDLYPTDGGRAFTPGEWSVLDGGSYNHNGCTPPLYSSFERYALGWLTPFQLSETSTVTLNPLKENEAAMFNTLTAEGESNPLEYFLLENRQQKGWDKYLPSHGMLIWHVDYNSKVWEMNEVNNNSKHQHVDLIEADGMTLYRTDRTADPFPGKKNVTEFSDITKPSASSWAGVPSGVSISGISEEKGLIIFNVNADSSVESPFTDKFNSPAIHWEYSGGRLYISGLAPLSTVTIYSLTGLIVATIPADSEGKASDIIPAHGVYILHTPEKSQRIIL